MMAGEPPLPCERGSRGPRGAVRGPPRITEQGTPIDANARKLIDDAGTKAVIAKSDTIQLPWNSHAL
jgi:hypothetical protein